MWGKLVAARTTGSSCGGSEIRSVSFAKPTASIGKPRVARLLDTVCLRLVALSLGWLWYRVYRAGRSRETRAVVGCG